MHVSELMLGWVGDIEQGRPSKGKGRRKGGFYSDVRDVWRHEEKDRKEHERRAEGKAEGKGTEKLAERPHDKEFTKYVISINIEKITARSVHSFFT